MRHGCGVWAAGSASAVSSCHKVPSYVDCVDHRRRRRDGRNGAIELASRLEARGLYCELRFLGVQEARAA